jgi:hypothetical protein
LQIGLAEVLTTSHGGHKRLSCRLAYPHSSGLLKLNGDPH